MSTSLGTAEEIEPRQRSSAYFSLALLTVVYALNFLDRQFLAIMAEPIKKDLGLSDTQLGALSGLVFAAFYTVLGLPLAWFADRTSRVRVVALSCALWSAFTGACGYAQSFWQLALMRAGVAIGEAGGTPPSHSIVASLFPAKQRAWALALYSLGLPVGVMCGSALGAFVADAWGWRRAFMVVGLPGVAIAAMVLMFVREPQPQQAHREGATTLSLLSVLRSYFQSPRIVALSLAGAFAAFFGYALLSWMPALLMRTKGLSLAGIGSYYSLVIGVALGVGTLLGGHVVDRAQARHAGVYAFAPALAMLLAIPFFVAGLFADSWQLALGLLMVPLILVSMYLAPTVALLQNVVSPHTRATSAAILLLVLNLIGLGGGPLFVGVVSDALGPVRGDALPWAMVALTPFLLLAAIVYLILWRLLSRGDRQ